jgi:transcriptional regulator with XRE-family HTH domain
MMNDEQRRQELADFLRTRRMRLSPEQAGLIKSGRRRTPGLRREEVAQLANVGVSWYTLLEQGRDIHPSREVLYGIAHALQLTPDEQRHLFSLADLPYIIDTYVSDEHVSPALRYILDSLNPVPAYVMGRRWNYLAWNSAADHVLWLSKSTPPYECNAIWRLFTDPTVRHIYIDPEWELVAQKVLAQFRADSALYTDEEWYKRLVADLQRASPEFRAWWLLHDVRGSSDTLKNVAHPLVGRLAFEHTVLQTPAQPELKIMVYTPLPETDTLDRLRRLVRLETVMSAGSIAL